MKRILSFIISLTLILALVPAKAGGALSAPEYDVPALPSLDGAVDLGGAKAALIDLDSGAVRFESRSDVSARPGSLTVIMTALLLIENTSADEWDVPLEPLAAVNSQWSRRGAQLGLKEGMTPTRRDLLYGLMLTGAADAAFVTETLLAGSEAAFVSLMNEKAAELSMTGTNFANGFGLGSGSHYTCAHDMALLSAYAMKNELFRETCAASEYVLSEGCGSKELKNTNEALSSYGCIGIKSGYDSEKEHCVITAFNYGGLRLCAVVLEAASDSAAYNIAEMLVSAGAASYVSEGGLVSSVPTNAVFRSNAEAALYSAPDGEALRTLVAKGETVRVCASAHTDSGDWLCIYRNEGFLWMHGGADLLLYTDDIMIENGLALSREYLKNEAVFPDAVISSRHLIKSVSISLYLPSGACAFTGVHEPGAYGVCPVSGSSLAETLSRITLSEGIYICEIQVTAEASCAGCEPETIVKTNRSLLSVGTGGECVSYNANLGEGAPDGECYFGSFTVPQTAPMRLGYEFAGWNSSRDGSGQPFSPGETAMAEGSFTLYAQWKRAESAWNANVRASYEGGLILEGTVSNPAGIVRLELEIRNSVGQTMALEGSCRGNEVEPGSVLISSPVMLMPGEYSLKLTALSAEGEAGVVYETPLTVDSDGPGYTEAPAVTEAPEITPAPGKTPFTFASIPIVVWFGLGIIVVIILIALIVYIIKHG
jgi:uncharacterized repeat protein (TIGR02543 family)